MPVLNSAQERWKIVNRLEDRSTDWVIVLSSSIAWAAKAAGLTSMYVPELSQGQMCTGFPTSVKGAMRDCNKDSGLKVKRRIGET